jgi:hypothetical protein
MKDNYIPDNLLSSANALLHGLEIHGTWIDASYSFIPLLNSKIYELQEAFTAAETAETTKAIAADRLMMADRVLKAWLTKARLVVMLARGARWSESWIHTGFVDRRTRVPKQLQARLDLAKALVAFFARHPELGVPFAEVTAARGRAICERAAQSSEMLGLAKKDCTVMNQRCRLAAADLRNTMRKVVAWLKTHVEGPDPRWADFGFAVPAAKKHCRRRSPRRSASVTRLSHGSVEGHHVAAA